MWGIGAKLVIIIAALSISFSAAAKESLDLDALRAKAEQGDAEAQFSLSNLYARGTGIKPDLPQSCFWLSLAGPDAKKPDSTHDKVCSQLDSAQQSAVMVKVVKAQSLLKQRTSASRP